MRARSGAHTTLVNLALTTSEFTTDDLWDRLNLVPGPEERRELGSIVTCAKTLGIIAETGLYRKSLRPECHSRPIPVWKSQIAPAHALPDNIIQLADRRPAQQTLLA